MADTWGSAPHSIYRDELLDGSTIEERGFFTVIKVMSNDVDLFEGDAGAFAHLIHAERADVERLFVALEARKLITRYRAEGRIRLVGKILRSFEGECMRKANPSQRTQSYLPFEDGTFFAGRDRTESKQAVAQPQVSGKRSASKRQATGNRLASDVQPTGNQPATNRQDRVEEKREEQSSSLCSEQKTPAANEASASAPSQPAPWGGGLGAKDPGPRPPPMPSPIPLPPAAITEDHPDPAGLAFVPTDRQKACMALRWGGDHTYEHSVALLAWAKECGVPETRLKRWLAKREEHDPWPGDWPLSKRTRRSKAPEEVYP